MLNKMVKHCKVYVILEVLKRQLTTPNYKVEVKLVNRNELY